MEPPRLPPSNGGRQGTPPGRPPPKTKNVVKALPAEAAGVIEEREPPDTVLTARSSLRGAGLASVLTARSRLQHPSESAAGAIATKDMQEMFDVFDDDHGGTIEAPEFANHLKSSLGFTLDQEALEGLFDTVDSSGNGHIDREEWVAMLRSILSMLEKRPVTPDDVRRALRATLLPAERGEEARVSISAIQPGFAKLGVRLTPEQANGVMLSALGLDQSRAAPSLVLGHSENQADGPHLENICEALVSALRRKDNIQAGTCSNAEAQDPEDTSPLDGSVALFGYSIALEMDDDAIGSNPGPLLQMVPLFANLDDNNFARLTEICQRSEVRYKKGDAIVKQGDVGNELFVLLSGTAYASIYSDGHGKKPTIVKNYSKGDYFGERALIDNDGKRAANVFVSSTDALCCKISRQEFYHLVGGLDRRADTESTDDNLSSRVSRHDSRQVISWRQQVSDVDAIEQWRALVRRFLWLDMLHDRIDQHRTMQGRKTHEQTEADVRLEISARCFFFAPDAPFVNQWQLFQVLVLVVTAILVPLRAGFDQIDGENPIFWFTYDLISDLYFWFDMILNFRTAYFDNHQKLVHNDKKVAWHYATGATYWVCFEFCGKVLTCVGLSSTSVGELLPLAHRSFLACRVVYRRLFVSFSSVVYHMCVSSSFWGLAC